MKDGRPGQNGVDVTEGTHSVKPLTRGETFGWPPQGLPKGRPAPPPPLLHLSPAVVAMQIQVGLGPQFLGSFAKLPADPARLVVLACLH